MKYTYEPNKNLNGKTYIDCIMIGDNVFISLIYHNVISNFGLAGLDQVRRLNQLSGYIQGYINWLEREDSSTFQPGSLSLIFLQTKAIIFHDRTHLNCTTDIQHLPRYEKCLCQKKKKKSIKLLAVLYSSEQSSIHCLLPPSFTRMGKHDNSHQRRLNIKNFKILLLI